MRGLSFIEKIVFVFNSLAALLLFLSYGLSFLPPKQFGFLAVLSLGVPILIILNLLFALYWLLRLKKQVFLSVLVLILGFKYLASMYRFSSIELPKTENSFTVMSYNVRLFNLYKWIDEDSLDQRIRSFVELEAPDILCIQEYHQNPVFELPSYYKYESLTGQLIKTGQAIFSKFPIVNSGAIKFPNTSNDAIFVDVVTKTDTLRVYNLHLQSAGINTSVASLSEESSENLINRVSKTFQIQQSQAELVLKHIGESPYQSMITGDFNNTPYSYVYSKIKGDFQDAFETAGEGFGSTYDFRFFPFRIDFVMVEDAVRVHNFSTFKLPYSDHYPIKATLSLH
jgi:endonuclease/exonuclease/phosphatase family metal-dependent hydrolase